MNRMPLEKLVEKAERLVKTGRVKPLGGGRYNVIGDHGTYTLSVQVDGRVACDCPGFQRRGVCSHVAAVIILRALREASLSERPFK